MIPYPRPRHFWSPRWQVESLSYFLRGSGHRTPPGKTRKISVSVHRSLARCHPLLLGAGSKEAISFHSLSIKSPAMVGPTANSLNHSLRQTPEHSIAMRQTHSKHFGMTSWDDS